MFHLAQTLPERRFLFWHYLSGDGSSGGDVPGDVRHTAHRRLVSAMAGDDHRPRAKDRSATPDLCRPATPRIAEAEDLAARQPWFSSAQASLELIQSRNSLSHRLAKANPGRFTDYRDHSISRSSPTDVFQNSNKCLRRASTPVSLASASEPEPSLGLRQEQHCLSR